MKRQRMVKSSEEGDKHDYFSDKKESIIDQNVLSPSLEHVNKSEGQTEAEQAKLGQLFQQYTINKRNQGANNGF